MIVGPGIAFLFALLFLAFISFVWIVAWLPKGFRLRRPGDQVRIRKVALGTVVAMIVLMLCFPPLRRTGQWSEPETGAPIPTELKTLYDRDEFGYIPDYAWIGRCSETEVREISETVTLAPHATYQLDAVSWTVDWWFFFAQLGIVFMFAFPFLFACDRNRLSEQPN